MSKKPYYINPRDVSVLTIRGSQLPIFKEDNSNLKPAKSLDPNLEKNQIQRMFYRPPYPLIKLFEFYEENTWHCACCNVKSKVIVGDWSIKPIEEGQEEDENFNKLKALLDKPNRSGETFNELLDKIWIDFETMGNSYMEVVRNRKGEVGLIEHVPAHSIRIGYDKPGFYQINSSEEFLVYFRKFGDDTDQNGKTEMLHFFNYYARSAFYGVPKFLAALNAMDLDRDSVTFNRKYFKNGGMLGSLVTVEGGKLSPDAKKELKEAIENNTVGVNNAFRVAVIDNLKEGAKLSIVKLLDQTGNREASFHILRKDNRDEIIAIHHVPPKLLGITTPGQLGVSNDSWGQMQVFNIVEVQPSQMKFENFLNTNLIQKGLNIENWKIKFKPMETDTQASVNTEIRSDVQSGILTVDEARDKRDLPPLGEGQTMTPEKVLQTINQIGKSLF